MRKERRSEPRWRVEYLATMVSGEGGPRYCVVTEMSEGGVRTNAIGFRVPEVFGLRLTGHAKTKSYRVIWRIGRDVGAKLISPAPSAQADRCPKSAHNFLWHFPARKKLANAAIRGSSRRCWRSSSPQSMQRAAIGLNPIT
jgi:hypothetical protein